MIDLTLSCTYYLDETILVRRLQRHQNASYSVDDIRVMHPQWVTFLVVWMSLKSHPSETKPVQFDHLLWATRKNPDAGANCVETDYVIHATSHLAVMGRKRC